MLPCEVRVTSKTHPLSGRLVAARAFKRLHGELLLVIELADGSPGTIRADATDVLGTAEPAGPGAVLDAAGFRRLRVLVTALAAGVGREQPGSIPAGLREAIGAYYAGLAAASAAELAGAGGAGYYLRQAALESVIAQRMGARAAVSIHRAPLAGATLAQVADVTGVTCAEAAERWRCWAGGQRRLGQQVPGLGLGERDYRRAAAVIEAGAATYGIVFPDARVRAEERK